MSQRDVKGRQGFGERVAREKRKADPSPHLACARRARDGTLWGLGEEEGLRVFLGDGEEFEGWESRKQPRGINVHVKWCCT